MAWQWRSDSAQKACQSCRIAGSPDCSATTARRPPRHALDAEPVVAEETRQFALDQRGPQAQVDKPRSRDLRRLAQIVDLQRGDDAFGNRPRAAAETLLEAHGAIRLIVAESGVR